MDQPHVIERTIVTTRPDISMRVVEYVLAGMALAAAFLLNLAH